MKQPVDEPQRHPLVCVPPQTQQEVLVLCRTAHKNGRMDPHPQELRDKIVERYLAGERLADIEADTGVSRPTIYTYIKAAGYSPQRRTKTAPLHLRDLMDRLDEANQTIGRLEAELAMARQQIEELRATKL